MPKHRRFPAGGVRRGRTPGRRAEGRTQVSDLRWLLLLLGLLKGADEEGLVDPALEDRYAELHALADYFAPVHASFPSELRGRQMDRHLPAPLLKRDRVPRVVPRDPDIGKFNRAVCAFPEPNL